MIHLTDLPWLITEAGMKRLSTASTDGPLQMFEQRPAMQIDREGRAIIYVHSALVESCAPIYETLGLATRYRTLINEIAQAQSQANQIVMHINSPGGSVAGLLECSEAIEASTIPVTAFCKQACSAAYWLACSTSRITASPSGVVGSVGAIMSWLDVDAMLQAAGVTRKAITNEGATLKSTFHTEPNAEQLAFLQETIDGIGVDFQNHVRANRPNISNEVFRAGWYAGSKAIELGLVDEIAIMTKKTDNTSLTRGQINAMSAADKRSYYLSLGTGRAFTPTVRKQLPRSEFDLLSPQGKMEFMREKGILV